MLQWKCEYCGHSVQITDSSQAPAVCPLCMAGKVQKGGGMNTAGSSGGPVFTGAGPVGMSGVGPIPRCSRLVYIVLAICLGWLGIHNFVAGYSNRGAWQLALGLTGLILGFCTFGISWILCAAVGIWAIVDIVQTTTDADGVRML